MSTADFTEMVSWIVKNGTRLNALNENLLIYQLFDIRTRYVLMIEDDFASIYVQSENAPVPVIVRSTNCY